ncbi:MAG: hypothetical protein JW910_03735 [Anaerolineae bacterium]|nr:hypothetical protein [Anaerolineae bacterium]
MYQRTIAELKHTITDSERNRYWSPASQAHATGDQLLRYLEEDWLLEPEVGVELVWFGEARHIVLFHFRLRKGSSRMDMPVLGNPFVNGLVSDAELGLKRVPYRRDGETLRFTVVTQRQPQQ